MKQTSNKHIWILFSVVATELIGFGLIIPLLPQLASHIEPNPYKLGFLMSAYSLAQFFAAPILGTLSDKFGRKPVLIFSKAGSVLSYLILAFAPSYFWFLMSRLLDGFTGGNISVARAYISDVTAPEDRSKGMAVIGIAFGTGFLLGPALGGLLYGRAGFVYTVPALVAGGLSFLALLLTIFVLKEPPKRRAVRTSFSYLGRIQDVLSKRSLQIICLVYLVYMVIFSGFETTFSVFNERMFALDEVKNSLIFMYIGFLALMVQGAIARRGSARNKQFSLIGFATFSLAFVMLSLYTSTVVLLLINLVLMSIGISFINTYLPSLLSTRVDPDKLGSAMGVFEAIGSLSRIVGPLLIYSSLFHQLQLAYLIYAVALILAATMLILGVDRKQEANV